MKKLSTLHRLILAAATAATAIFSTGCGNWMQTGVHMAPSSSYQGGAINYTNVTGNGGFPNDTTHTCVSSPSIITAGGADPYTICDGNTNPFEISLHGNPTAGKSQVCVFPVDVISATVANADSDSNGAVLDQRHIRRSSGRCAKHGLVPAKQHL